MLSETEAIKLAIDATNEAVKRVREEEVKPLLDALKNLVAILEVDEQPSEADLYPAREAIAKAEKD